MLKTTKQTKKQSAFSKKWQQVEKKQTRNINYKNKINKLYQEFNAEILPIEEQLCEMIAEESVHLMKFIDRKSFTNWQREELIAWIESNIDTLHNHPFVPDGLAKKVVKIYNEHLSKNFKKITKDEMIAPEHITGMRELLVELEVEDNYSDEQLADFIRDPQTFTEHIEKIMAERVHEAEQQADEEQLDDQFFEQFEEEFINSDHFQQFQQTHQKHQKKLKDLFNASLLKKCYKKLATILHPDKEQNPELKVQKSELMAILIQAKKDKDAFTIISMYQEHVPDNDLNLDADVSAELLELIGEKLKQLELAHHQFKNEPSIENMIWQKLGGRSKKEREELKKQHIIDIEDGCFEIKVNIMHCKNMKQLNQVLSKRYDQRHQSPAMDFEMLKKMMQRAECDGFPFK